MSSATSSSLTSTNLVETPISSVQISVHALLKIMQHARDAQANNVTGQLLGMDNEGVLEITDMYPFVTNSHDETEQEEYQIDMMKALRDVNVDHNTCGWYQTCATDGFINQALIEGQYTYQSTIANSIVLIYDHLLSSQGLPALKALRLKSEFMNLFRDKKFKSLDSFVGMDLFEILPVHIQIGSMEQIFCLNLSLPPMCAVNVPETEEIILRTSANNLISSIDEVLAEAGRLQHHVRSSVKQQQALGSQLHRLKNENAQRSQTGEELLAVESVLSNFRPSADPSRLAYLLSSSNIQTLAMEAKEVAQSEASTISEICN